MCSAISEQLLNYEMIEISLQLLSLDLFLSDMFIGIYSSDFMEYLLGTHKICAAGKNLSIQQRKNIYEKLNLKRSLVVIQNNKSSFHWRQFCI